MKSPSTLAASRSQQVLFRISLAGVLLLATSCSDVPTGPEPSFKPGVAQRVVTIDFTTFGQPKVFDPDFYRSDGILFPPLRCGTEGCEQWFTSFVQGDAALRVEDVRFGPIEATLTRPISDLTLRVAPALQGTATYFLSGFGASGKLLATTSVTVTQDFGDPANTGFGYFTISLANLAKPAKSFKLDVMFVRSSFPLNTFMPYGVSSISYTHWGKKP
jgi:hypothetical protein